jgi:hypothetical protein
MYDRVLVSLDGSDFAEAALLFAELTPSRHLRLLVVEPVVLVAAHSGRPTDPPRPEPRCPRRGLAVCLPAHSTAIRNVWTPCSTDTSIS